jgi:hypothetical protein
MTLNDSEDAVVSIAPRTLASFEEIEQPSLVTDRDRVA